MQKISHGEMIRMREAGFTYDEIARKSGIPYGTVRSRLQAWGIKPLVKIVRQRNRQPVHNYPRWLIFEMYWICELSTGDIAYELDITRNSVSTMMRRLKIPLRSRAEAWDLMRRRDRMPPRHHWTPEQARIMSLRSAAIRKK